jgi:hypothetical protein
MQCLTGDCLSLTTDGKTYQAELSLSWPSSSGPRRAPVRLAPLRSAPISFAPRMSARVKSAFTSTALMSRAPRRSTVPGDTVASLSGDDREDRASGGGLPPGCSALSGCREICRASLRSPAIVRPIAMPVPIAPQPIATAAAAAAPTHWPTAATATSGRIGQDQGDLAMDGTSLRVATQGTYHRSLHAVRQDQHRTVNVIMHGSLLRCRRSLPFGLGLNLSRLGEVVTWRSRATEA